MPSKISVDQIAHSNETNALEIDTSGNVTIQQDLKFAGNAAIKDSAGNNVISESAGVVTVNADAAVISGSSTGDLVRITQTGTGNALVVEDSTNPDATPFVVNAGGLVGIGTSSPQSNLEISAATNTSVQLTTTADSTPVLDFRTNGTDRLRISSSSATGATFNVRSNQEMQFYTNNTERMRIDSSGSVLIGTTTNGGVLSINGLSDGASRIRLYNQSVDMGALGSELGFFGFGNANDLLLFGGSNLGIASNGIVKFTSGGATERMRIDSSGNVLVGDTNSGYNSRILLKSPGSTSSTSAIYALNSSNTLIFQVRSDGLVSTGTASVSPYNYTTGGSANVVVDSSGSLLRVVSSIKYKTDVEDATHGLAEVLQLRPVTYKSKNDGDKVFGGLIAEEVHEAGLIEFVQYAEDGSPDALHYSSMVSLAFKAIQEQQTIIEALTTRIEALESN